MLDLVNFWGPPPGRVRYQARVSVEGVVISGVRGAWDSRVEA